MKKVIIFVLTIVCNLCFGQDSLYIGTPQTDTLACPLIDCYPYECGVEASRTYIVATDYRGTIYVAGDGLVEVLIMTENYVHLDTCGQMFPFLGGDFILSFIFPAAARLVISSVEGPPVTVLSKVDTSVVRPLPLPIVWTDTLCPATPIFEPQTPAKWSYFDPFSLQKVVDLQPNKAYLRRKSWD